MKLYNVIGIISSMVLLAGCGASWEAPAPFSKKIDPKLLEIGTIEEINNLISKDNYHSINTNYNHNGVTYDYTYQFYLENSSLVSKFNGKCSLSGRYNNLDYCYGWSHYKPSELFFSRVENAKKYYSSDELYNQMLNYKNLAPKIEACQNKINPQVNIKDETGILGTNLHKYFASNVKWNKATLNNYLATDNTNFECGKLKDTFQVDISSSSEFMFNNKNKDFYTLYASNLDSKNAFPPYLIKSLQYQFFNNIYMISDKYIKVVMQPSGYQSDKIMPKINVENLTPEFLELQGITIYYGDKVSEYLGTNDSHIDISPETSTEIISNKTFILNGIKPRYVPINSLQDTIKIGLAIKYKIKSTNQIQTLYKTELLKIQQK